MSTTAGDLAVRLVEFVLSNLEAVERNHLPGWRIPGTFAGHGVGADVRADLCYTLHHLADAGVDSVAGTALEQILVQLLGGVDGSATHSFFSYRIAEVLRRGGPMKGNRFTTAMTARQVAELELAVDNSDWIPQLESGALPRNYAAVLARCELGRVELGLGDETQLDRLVDRLRRMLGVNPLRMFDDSVDGVGRYDIYAADIWLFCLPLAAPLGSLWNDGISTALDLVTTTGARDGSAVVWGRSTGDLSVALTLELAALALAEPRVGDGDPGDPGRWMRRALDATETLTAGFDADGLTNAHRHRGQDRYRGPGRRLQLTFDLLGKVAWAASLLRSVPPDVVACSVATTYPSVDRWLAFETDRPAGVWVHRSPGAGFLVPFVGSTRSHYLPALHEPGTWEVPVDRDLPTWTPLVIAGGHRYTAGEVPNHVQHRQGGLTARWEGLNASGGGGDGSGPHPPLPATRVVDFSVDGRSVVVDDHLRFSSPPQAVSMVIPEITGRPIDVCWSCPTAHTTDRIEVAGLAEWRTVRGEVAVVHQIDFEPAAELRYRARVTPLMRVASTELDHHYSRSLYGPMSDRVVSHRTPVGWHTDPDPAFRQLDLLHVHWPEWVAFDDLAAHEAIIAELAEYDIPIVWTAHNLTPHEKRPEIFDPIYSAWAQAVDAVIHHSAWGRDQMLSRYRFGEGCIHEVIPHGHFGPLWAAAGLPTRAEAEARLGLKPVGLRIGVVGAPRAEKLVQEVLDGVAGSRRADVQLVCWSLGPGDVVPDDPRIAIARPYRKVSPEAYATRLACCDVLALVFDAEGEMLATGAAADSLGLGLPALRSEWGYLIETLADSGIPVGQTATSIALAIDALTPERLNSAEAAAGLRRNDLDWGPLAQSTADLFERVILHRSGSD